jgi:hypothetical protein
MDIFIADLDEDAATFGEQFACGGEPVAEVGEIGMDAEFPGVAEGADLFGLAGVASSALPSFTSRLRVLTCQLEPNLIP